MLERWRYTVQVCVQRTLLPKVALSDLGRVTVEPLLKGSEE